MKEHVYKIQISTLENGKTLYRVIKQHFLLYPGSPEPDETILETKNRTKAENVTDELNYLADICRNHAEWEVIRRTLNAWRDRGYQSRVEVEQ